MSGSSEGDPEGGQGSGGVAGVVTEGSGEVDRPRPAEHADDQVAQARHDLRGGAGADLGGVSAKVVSRTWCGPFSIAQCQRR
jgi:hypothetical protein